MQGPADPVADRRDEESRQSEGKRHSDDHDQRDRHDVATACSAPDEELRIGDEQDRSGGKGCEHEDVESSLAKGFRLVHGRYCEDVVKAEPK